MCRERRIDLEELKTIQNVTDCKEIRDHLIKRLNAWSNVFGVTELFDFGEKIDIKKIIYCPIDIFVINSMFESRIVSKRKEPYSGSEVIESGSCKYYEPKDVDPFSIKLNSSPLDYSKVSYTTVVPDSNCIESCKECQGKGKIECNVCGSKGNVVCTNCSGSGKTKCMMCMASGFKGCSYCYGVGIRKEERVIEQFDSSGKIERNRYFDDVQCLYCKGLGRLQCTSCSSGTIICDKCGGQQEIECLACAGKGSKKCVVCTGAGKFISNLMVTQDFNAFFGSELFIRPELLKIYPDFKIRNENGLWDFNKIHEIAKFESREALQTISCLDFIPKSYELGNNYHNVIEKLIINECSKSTSDNLVKQKISFYQADVYVVFYEYSEKKFTLILNTYSDEVLSMASPFIEIAKELVKKAATQVNSNRYGKAMEFVIEADKLSVGTPFKTITTKTINEIAKLMTKNYKVGVQISCGLYFIYEVIASILNIINKPNFAYLGLLFHMFSIGIIIILFNTIQKKLIEVSKKVVITNDKFRIGIGIMVGLCILYLFKFLIDIFLK